MPSAAGDIYIASGTGGPEQVWAGMRGIAGALFPDPSAAARAAALGATARHADQSTSDLVNAQEAKRAYGQAVQDHLQNPSADTAGRLQGIGLNAGLTPAQTLPGIFGSVGLPGTGAAWTPGLVDRQAAASGAQQYGGTQSGVREHNQTAITTAGIAAGPANRRVSLEERIHADQRIPYTDPANPTVILYTKPGETPPPNMRPLPLVVGSENQTIASRPAQTTADDAVKARQQQTHPYVDPKAPDVIQYLTPDKTPAPNTIPLASYFGQKSVETQTAPAMANAATTAKLAETTGQRTYAVVDHTKPNGYGVITVPTGEQPPPGAIPHDEKNPIATMQAIAALGAASQPAPSGAPQAGPAAGAPTAPTAPRVADIFTRTLEAPAKQVAVPDDAAVNAQFERFLADYEAQTGTKIAASPELRSAVYIRQGEIYRQNGNNMPAAVQQAISEVLAGGASEETGAKGWFTDTKTLRPGGAQGAAVSGPQGAPASPGFFRRLNDGNMTPQQMYGGTPAPAAAPTRAPAAAPTQAQAPPPWPNPNPAQRAPGVYMTPSGPRTWTEQGWTR